MLRRIARAAALLAVMTVALSACELTVRIGTDINADGSGTFRLAIALDEELVEGLAQAAEASEETSSIETLEALFARLAEQGWETTRSSPKGGLLLEASRAFADADGFDATLEQLAGAGGDEAQPVDLGSLDLDYQVSRSFLRTRSTFEGRIDLGFGDDADPIVEQLADVLADAVHFEISARLPGNATVLEGGGTVEGDTIIWRPEVGSATRFLAESSQLRTTTLLMIIVPALVLVALIGWLLMGKRPRDQVLDLTEAEVDPVADTKEHPAVLAEVTPNGARPSAEATTAEDPGSEPLS